MMDELCWLRTHTVAAREVGSGMADFGGVDAHKLAMAVMMGRSDIAGSASMGELLDKVEKSTGLGLSDIAGLATGLMR